MSLKISSYWTIISSNNPSVVLCRKANLWYMHSYTHVHICTAHGSTQVYTCCWICDSNQINWPISAWKRHMQTWRPLVVFSWMLLTLTRAHAASMSRVTACSPASASLYGSHVWKNYYSTRCLTEEEFLSAPLESSSFFKLQLNFIQGLFFLTT